MATTATPIEPIPTGLTRTFGFLNLATGSLLSLVGAGLLYLFVPFLQDNDPLQLDPIDAQLFINELRRSTLVQLQQDEAAAKGPEAKALIAKSRRDLEAKTGKIDEEVDFKKVNEQLPWISRYLWADLLSAPLLNVLLAISGLGLLFLKGWARRLALIVAGLKIARLLTLSLFLLFVVVPNVGETFRAFARSGVVDALIHYGLNQVNSQGMISAQISPAEFAEILIAMGRGHAIASVFFGSVFPVVMLIVLTRPSARAACAPKLSAKP